MVSSKKSKIKKEIQMIVCLTLASVIMAFNLNSFVAAGGLFPSGFSGLTILIQDIAREFFNIRIP